MILSEIRVSDCPFDNTIITEKYRGGIYKYNLNTGSKPTVERLEGEVKV